MERKRKRNNYTLSIEAQEVIDQQKNKSKFVSDAIVSKGAWSINRQMTLPKNIVDKINKQLNK